MTTAATIPSVTKSRFISISSTAPGQEFNRLAQRQEHRSSCLSISNLNGARTDRLDFERQSIHFSHAHARALRNRLTSRPRGAPQFAMDANHSGDFALAGRGFDRLGDFALFREQLFLARRLLPGPRAQDQPHQDDYDYGKRKRDAERGAQAHA